MEGDEAKHLGDTVKGQDHSHDKANKNPVKNIKVINSQRTSNGAKDKPLMKGQDIKQDRKDKSGPKRGVVNTKENNIRSKIPVFENSNIIAVNHVNGDDHIKVQRKCSLPSEKVSSCDTKSSKTSSESVDIKGNKLYTDFMDIKLSSSHSLQQKPSNKAVEKQNSKGSVDTGVPGRILAKPAARRLKQRGGSHTETGHPHNVGRDNSNNVTNGDHQINVSSNSGNTEEGEISLRNAVRKSSQGSSMSVEYRRKRQAKKSSHDSLMSADNRTRAQKATKHGKMAKKNANRQREISIESVTQNSEISQIAWICSSLVCLSEFYFSNQKTAVLKEANYSMRF